MSYYHICQSQDPNVLMQSDYSNINIAIAKLICLDLGW